MAWPDGVARYVNHGPSSPLAAETALAWKRGGEYPPPCVPWRGRRQGITARYHRSSEAGELSAGARACPGVLDGLPCLGGKGEAWAAGRLDGGILWRGELAELPRARPWFEGRHVSCLLELVCRQNELMPAGSDTYFTPLRLHPHASAGSLIDAGLHRGQAPDHTGSPLQWTWIATAEIFDPNIPRDKQEEGWAAGTLVPSMDPVMRCMPDQARDGR